MSALTCRSTTLGAVKSLYALGLLYLGLRMLEMVQSWVFSCRVKWCSMISTQIINRRAALRSSLRVTSYHYNIRSFAFIRGILEGD